MAAPKLRNDLPLFIRNISSVNAFKKALKTHLFQKAFPANLLFLFSLLRRVFIYDRVVIIHCRKKVCLINTLQEVPLNTDLFSIQYNYYNARLLHPRGKVHYDRVMMI